MSLQEDLREMYDSVDEQVEDLEDQIAQVDQLISELEGEVSVIENTVMTTAANDLESYLDSTKVLEIEQLIGESASLVIGPTYNDIANIYSATLTDWRIIDTTANIVYEYEGIGWDGDTIVIGHISNWDFGKDYLIHPLNTFDGNYGLYPNISALTNTRNTLDSTKTKIANSKSIIGDYL